MTHLGATMPGCGQGCPDDQRLQCDKLEQDGQQRGKPRKPRDSRYYLGCGSGGDVEVASPEMLLATMVSSGASTKNQKALTAQ